MISRRFLLTLLFPLVMLPALAASAAAQSADEVVERHLAAIGGREALAKLTSRKVTGAVTLSRPAGDLSGTVEIYSKPPNRTRSVIRLNISALGGPDEMTSEQIFDGRAGYAMNSIQGNSEILGRQLDAMRNNAFPTPLLVYKAAGAALEVLPKEDVNGRDAIVLRVTPKTGSPSRIFFDAATYLIVRTITTIDSPTGGPLEQTSDLSDYRTVDGLKVPFMVVNANQLQTVTIVLSKVEHNVQIDDAMFVKK